MHTGWIEALQVHTVLKCFFCEELSEQLHTIAIDKELFAIASAISKLYAVAFACSFHLQTVNSSSIDIPLRQAFIPCFHYK